jgi:hypothetical protein
MVGAATEGVGDRDARKTSEGIIILRGSNVAFLPRGSGIT